MVRLAEFVLRHRKRVMLFWLVMFLVGGFAASKVPDLIIQLRASSAAALTQVRCLASANHLTLTATVNHNQFRAHGTAANRLPETVSNTRSCAGRLTPTNRRCPLSSSDIG